MVAKLVQLGCGSENAPVVRWLWRGNGRAAGGRGEEERAVAGPGASSKLSAVEELCRHHMPKQSPRWASSPGKSQPTRAERVIGRFLRASPLFPVASPRQVN